jgi:hypothetical protein
VTDNPPSGPVVYTSVQVSSGEIVNQLPTQVSRSRRTA